MVGDIRLIDKPLTTSVIPLVSRMQQEIEVPTNSLITLSVFLQGRPHTTLGEYWLA